MEALILASPVPIPSPSLSPSELLQKLDQMDWGSLIQAIINGVSGTSQHPVLSMIGVGVVTAIGGLLYFLFKGKITQWLADLAQASTDQGKTDWVNDNTPQNQVDTNQDNSDKGKIDGAS